MTHPAHPKAAVKAKGYRKRFKENWSNESINGLFFSGKVHINNCPVCLCRGAIDTRAVLAISSDQLWWGIKVV